MPPTYGPPGSYGSTPPPGYGPPSSYGMPTPFAPMTGGHRRVGKVRNPFGVWVLSLITCGIYGLYLHFKLNDEARQYDSRIQVDPALSLGAMFLPIFNIVSIVRTGGRIGTAQEAAGIPKRCSGGIGFLLAFLGSFHLIYYQSHLNQIWALHGNLPEGSAV